jgi:hypothetical protein
MRSSGPANVTELATCGGVEMHIKLSKRSVDLAAPHSGGRTMIFDTEIPGFALRITENGVKTFVLRYSRGGRSRWFTIGRTNAMTPEQARREAIRLRGIVASGTDPAAERAQARAIPTFREFAERYLAEHSALKKKPRSYREDQLKIARYILPKLGNFRSRRSRRRMCSACTISCGTFRPPPIACSRSS